MWYADSRGKLHFYSVPAENYAANRPYGSKCKASGAATNYNALRIPDEIWAQLTPYTPAARATISAAVTKRVAMQHFKYAIETLNYIAASGAHDELAAIPELSIEIARLANCVRHIANAANSATKLGD